MSDSLARVQGRKWQVTINHPVEHGLLHDQIKTALSICKGLLYYCLCDDESGDGCETLHTHVFVNPCTAEMVGRMFPKMHRERVAGTCAENRAYVWKDGEKYNKQDYSSYQDSSGKVHKGVNFSDTFEEWGELLREHQGKSRTDNFIVSMVKDGASILLRRRSRTLICAR